jgi:hypothetical protein
MLSARSRGEARYLPRGAERAVRAVLWKSSLVLKQPRRRPWER